MIEDDCERAVSEGSSSSSYRRAFGLPSWNLNRNKASTSTLQTTRNISDPIPGSIVVPRHVSSPSVPHFDITAPENQHGGHSQNYNTDSTIKGGEQGFKSRFWFGLTPSVIGRSDSNATSRSKLGWSKKKRIAQEDGYDKDDGSEGLEVISKREVGKHTSHLCSPRPGTVMSSTSGILPKIHGVRSRASSLFGYRDTDIQKNDIKRYWEERGYFEESAG